MGTILNKTRSVLVHVPHPMIDVSDEELVVFTHERETDPADQGHERVVLLAPVDWEDMGRPETVTVTIEPGDTLNEASSPLGAYGASGVPR